MDAGIETGAVVRTIGGFALAGDVALDFEVARSQFRDRALSPLCDRALDRIMARLPIAYRYSEALSRGACDVLGDDLIDEVHLDNVRALCVAVFVCDLAAGG